MNFENLLVRYCRQNIFILALNEAFGCVLTWVNGNWLELFMTCNNFSQGLCVRSTKNQELEHDSSKSSFSNESTKLESELNKSNLNVQPVLNASTSKIEKVENEELESLSSNSSFANESAKLWLEAESMKTLKKNITPVFNATTTKIEKVESLMDKINKDQKSLQSHIKEVCLRDGIGNGLNINDLESRMVIDQKRHFAYCGIGKV